MTQEELIELAIRRDAELFIELQDFFEEHVCIKKGVNRHPYADVLHEWLEGTEIEVKLDGEWTDYMCSLDYIKQYEYRIKSQDTVYEWRWYGEISGVKMTTDYMSDEEFHSSTLSYDYWTKIEETKRERKQ